MSATQPMLLHQRCRHHAAREAVARCPSCGHFYCRECITEHEDRVVCAACLKKLTGQAAAKRHRFGDLARLAQCVTGLFLCWVTFYLLGRALLAIPSSFHEGTVWVDTGNIEEPEP